MLHGNEPSHGCVTVPPRTEEISTIKPIQRLKRGTPPPHPNGLASSRPATRWKASECYALKSRKKIWDRNRPSGLIFDRNKKKHVIVSLRYTTYLWNVFWHGVFFTKYNAKPYFVLWFIGFGSAAQELQGQWCIHRQKESIWNTRVCLRFPRINTVWRNWRRTWCVLGTQWDKRNNKQGPKQSHVLQT